MLLSSQYSQDCCSLTAGRLLREGRSTLKGSVASFESQSPLVKRNGGVAVKSVLELRLVTFVKRRFLFVSTGPCRCHLCHV